MSKIGIGVICGIIGLVVGYVLGRFVKNHKVKKVYDYLDGVFRNLDNYVMIVSALIVCISIILSVLGRIETFASVTINIFGTIVFSWLLTKKSSKEEFREHEQDLSLRAYRHINYLESSANSAYKMLEEFCNEDEISKEVKLMMNNAMSQIKYIQGGIKTCKMDWVDMLSPEQQQKYGFDECTDNDSEDYGTIKVQMPNMDVNQEDV